MDPSNYQSVYDSLGSQYQPQTDLINNQIAQLQPQQDAEQAGLDQAKVNAFKDITSSANAKGVLFSGVPIDQQSTYVGTKYLPAVANLKVTYQNNKNTLLSQINDLQAKRVQQAQGTVADYAKNKADADYKNAELALSAQRKANSAAKGSGGLTAYQQAQLLSQYKISNKKTGGLGFTGPNGAIPLYQYAAATSGGDANATYDSIKTLLARSGDPSDKGALAGIQRLEKAGKAPVDILKSLKASNPYLF